MIWRAIKNLNQNEYLFYKEGRRKRVFKEQKKEQIDILVKSIYEKAGVEFNINSPKQLGEVLFEKMGIPGGKKTKVGYSTAEDVLEKLQADYNIVSEILQYRKLKVGAQL